MSSLQALRPLPRRLAGFAAYHPVSRTYKLNQYPRTSLIGSSNTTTTTTRHLSTTAARYTMSQEYKYEYLVTIPDVPGALDKRLAARPTHLANLKPRIESGQVVFGGATLSKQPADGENPDMTGSAMLIKANSEEEVRAIVEGDAYVKGGAWDVSKMVITPFRCAVRTAM